MTLKTTKKRLRKISIRWRKSSATHVIYIAHQIFESGFGDEDAAKFHLVDLLDKTDEKLHEVYKITRQEIRTFFASTPINSKYILIRSLRDLLEGVEQKTLCGWKIEQAREALNITTKYEI